jgi:hypothetical protein
LTQCKCGHFSRYLQATGVEVDFDHNIKIATVFISIIVDPIIAGAQEFIWHINLAWKRAQPLTMDTLMWADMFTPWN